MIFCGSRNNAREMHGEGQMSSKIECKGRDFQLNVQIVIYVF